MLQLIRDRAQGIIAWVIIGALIVVFALWGVGSYFESDPRVLIARVSYPGFFTEDAEIFAAEYDNAHRITVERYRNIFGKDFDIQDLGEKTIQNQVLESLIQEKLLDHVTDDIGMQVGAAQVDANIRASFPEMSVAQINESVSRQYGSGEAFREIIRKNAQRQQFFAAINQSAFVTDQELKKIYELEEQKRDIRYAIIAKLRFAGDAPSEEDIQKHYEKNKNNYRVAEQFTFDFIEIDATKIAKTLPAPSEKQLNDLYEEYKNQFSVAEERRASHILITLGDGENAGSEAEKKINDIAKAISDGASFEEQAKKHSQDDLSARKGGDLGFISQSSTVMERSFMDALYSLKKDEMSKPVRTSFGWHLIKATEIKAGKTKTFAEVKAELISQYQKQEGDRQFSDQLNRAQTMAFEQPSSLEPVADALGLKIQNQGPVDMSQVKGVLANPRVIRALKGEDVQAGNNSSDIEIAPGKVIFVRIKERIPSKQQALEEVKSKVIQELRKIQSQKKLKTFADEIKEKLNKGEDPIATAKSNKFSWKSQVGLSRNESKIDRSIVNTAFKTDVNKFKAVAMSNGDYALVTTDKIIQADYAKIDKAKKETLQRRMTRTLAGSDWQAVLKDFEAKADVKRYPDRIER